ncbi:hypothetical protein CANINC_003828 [Pichia inconspicua]|uniref:Uncharacterized protein n=1 Tax=Pichia inconspicua TaxID=52247 RepID=A0A4T0WZ21_9ASCO|nr:hypothetical protein CANINC_003828 [[Candida] inconspicua]
MAPALPIYRREEIEKMYPKSERFNVIPDNCKLYQLLQNECTYDGNKVYCLPFKRVFMRCYEYKNNEMSGYKLQGKNGRDVGRDLIYRNVEITSRKDNRVRVDDEMVRNFLEADLILKRNMNAYYERERGGK